VRVDILASRTLPGDLDAMSAIQSARAGDPAGLAQLYSTHGPGLYRLAFRLTGSREDAEDVVHDLFVALPEALSKYEERGRLKGWLRQIVSRLALLKVRSRKRRESDLPCLSGMSQGHDNDSVLETIALRAAVDALPDDLRMVLVLKDVEGYAHSEIAHLLGISIGASRVRLYRARRVVRNAMGSTP
jgi:RNA polymerase sigma-70 factor (ECF subfamily)